MQCKLALWALFAVFLFILIAFATFRFFATTSGGCWRLFNLQGWKRNYGQVIHIIQNFTPKLIYQFLPSAGIKPGPG